MLENSVYFVEKLDGSTTWPGHLKADDNEKRFWAFYKSKLKKKKWRKRSDVFEWTGEISQTQGIYENYKNCYKCLLVIDHEEVSIIFLAQQSIHFRKKVRVEFYTE